MNERSKHLQSVIEETRKVRESIDVLAATEDKAILSAMGIVLSDSESDSETDTDTISLDPCGESEILPSLWLDIPSFDYLQQVLETASYNWFEVVQYVEEQTKCDYETLKLQEYLNGFYSHLLDTLNDMAKINLLKQSFDAFTVTITPLPDVAQIAAILSGEVVSDSESDDADDYVGLTPVVSPHAKKPIEKKRKSLARRIRRTKAKEIAKANFLSKKVSKKVKNVNKFPDIGKSIENFVQDCNVGADVWRTGVLTFNGNRCVKKKATFERIRRHLEETTSYPVVL